MDMYRYIPPCLGTDVPAVAGSRSLCILAQGMRRSSLIGIGKEGRSARIERPERVWFGLVWAQGCFGTPSDTKL